MPESKTPRGDADAAGHGPDLQVFGEVLEVRRDVRFGAGEEVVEHPQDGPVLHFLALELQPRRADAAHIARFAAGFQRHHRGDALPGGEERPGDVPSRGRLSPAGEEERTPERAAGADAVGGVHGDDARAGSDDLAGQSDGRTD